ncbi:MAG: alpha/beta fold hydrolase [Rubrivivax sp.]|nr:alpha/beta fold hydrolase [Rubrivivax sp.]
MPALLAAALITLSAFSPPARSQTTSCGATEGRQLSGAYRTATGELMSILPAGAPGRWRITHFGSGRSHQLYPDGDLRFQSASDLDSEHPVDLRYAFKRDASGVADSLVINERATPPTIAKRVALVDRPAAFKSGDIDLQGRLTLPSSGSGPFKAVIFVHGSDPVSSVGQEWLPHLLAANGIATLVFDKRGTGCSKGQYVQHFEVLAGDVVAAARWLRDQPEIDPGQVGLAGFSQGGWVAPLAALKDHSIKFVAIGYGLAMSMADEDRLEAPLKLKEQGVDEASIAEFQALNAALHKLARDGFKDWTSFEQQVERVKDRPWFVVASRQQSWLGVTMQMGLAQAKLMAPQMFQNFFQPFYDPVPTLENLDVPMLWLVAGKDIEAPPEPTLEVLARLRRQGKPISVVIFPNADHGMQDFEVQAGKRVRTKYADRYFSTLLKWFQDPK